jgi:hypothetical protein
VNNSITLACGPLYVLSCECRKQDAGVAQAKVAAHRCLQQTTSMLNLDAPPHSADVAREPQQAPRGAILLPTPLLRVVGDASPPGSSSMVLLVDSAGSF